MDILFSLHFKDIRQCIYEVYKTSYYHHPTRQYQPRCLHIGIKETKEDEKHLAQFFCDNSKYLNYIFKGDELLPEFKGIASKYYRIDKGKFKGVFINFKNYSTSQLDALFNGVSSSGMGGCDTTAVASNLNGSNKGNIGYVWLRLSNKFKFNVNQFCGIAGNLVHESSFDPKREQMPGKPKRGGKGIAQWDTERRYLFESEGDINKGHHNKRIIDASLEEQVDYMIWELENEFKKVVLHIKNTNNIADATRIFCEEYEKAGNPNMCQRIKYANLVKQMIDAGQIKKS